MQSLTLLVAVLLLGLSRAFIAPSEGGGSDSSEAVIRVRRQLTDDRKKRFVFASVVDTVSRQLDPFFVNGGNVDTGGKFKFQIGRRSVEEQQTELHDSELLSKKIVKFVTASMKTTLQRIMHLYTDMKDKIAKHQSTNKDEVISYLKKLKIRMSQLLSEGLHLSSDAVRILTRHASSKLLTKVAEFLNYRSRELLEKAHKLADKALKYEEQAKSKIHDNIFM